MLLAARLAPGTWKIMGSDVSARMLTRARSAHYAMVRAEHLPRALLTRFCLRGVRSQEGTFRLMPDLRRRVNFRQINLIAPLPEGGVFDLIFLRNVLIHFDMETKAPVVRQLCSVPRPGGFFFCGHSESLHGMNLPLTSLQPAMSDIITKTVGLRLLGLAPDPLYALEKRRGEWPDVIVLAVAMPRMDGITFLRKIMAERPTPVVICSTLTEKGADTTMRALAAGAVAIIVKPEVALKRFLEKSAVELARAIKATAQARVGLIRPALVRLAKVPAKLNADVVLAPPAGQALAQTTERIVAIGTSTGGTQALEVVLTTLPRVAPGIVIVQHMPEKFTAACAARLNIICAIEVREAVHNDRVTPGFAPIAPGGRHLLLKRRGAYYHVDIVAGPPGSRHRPSVDVLFRSTAKAAGRNALGVIMTGMGDDGAAGLKEMFDAGARPVAQDEATCVIYGMPKEAVKRGAVQRSLPLGAIAGEIGRDR